MSVSVKYKGNEIAKLSESGQKTLLTEGKYCDANIVVENTESGGSGGESETWVLNESPALASELLLGDFVSCGISFKSIAFLNTQIQYDQSEGEGVNAEVVYDASWSIPWKTPKYRKLVFTTPPTGDLLTYLQANATKQPSNIAVQPALTQSITANGTTTITPSAPYDALSSVQVEVNVPSSGGIVWVDPN